MLSNGHSKADAQLDNEGKRVSRKRKRASDGPPNIALTQAVFAPEMPRCAGATLQLDVDMLMLEYLLHQAIAAQFMVLKPADDGPDTANGNTQETELLEEGAYSVLQCFQASLALFRLFHPDQDFEAGTAFNMILLETVLLLRALESKPGTINNSPSSTRDYNGLIETRDMLHRRMLTTKCDQSDHSILFPPSDAGADSTVKMLKDFLFYGWTSEGLQDKEQRHNAFDTYRLLGRFMVLSSRIAQQLGTTGINQHWMRLAGELMLHAAIEALEASDFIRSNGDINPQKSVAAVQPGLLDCFAFRYLPPETYDVAFLQYRRSPFDDALGSMDRVSARFSSSMKDEEQAISEMFAEDAELWNSHRLLYLGEFAIPARILDEAADEEEETKLERLAAYYRQRATELRLTHPFAETKASLVLCLESLWELNTSPDISGKPVLVQIEEGGLEGFTDEQFQHFLARVGLEKLTSFERATK